MGHFVNAPINLIPSTLFAKSFHLTSLQFKYSEFIVNEFVYNVLQIWKTQYQILRNGPDSEKTIQCLQYLNEWIRVILDSFSANIDNSCEGKRNVMRVWLPLEYTINWIYHQIKNVNIFFVLLVLMEKLGKPRHRLCCTTLSGWIFLSTSGTHYKYFFLYILFNVILWCLNK